MVSWTFSLQAASRVVQPFRRSHERDQQTDIPCYFVRGIRPHRATAVMRPTINNNNSQDGVSGSVTMASHGESLPCLFDEFRVSVYWPPPL